jgi:competence protein ComGC
MKPNDAKPDAELHPESSSLPGSNRLGRASKSLGRIGLVLCLMNMVLFLSAVAGHWWGAASVSLAVFVVPLLCALAATATAVVAVCQSKFSATPSDSSPASAGLKTGLGTLLLLGLLTLMVAPNFVKARTTSGKSACPSNLRILDSAKEQWALENKKTATDTPTWDDLIGTDKYIKVQPSCPANGSYTLNSMARKPRCSISDHTMQ